MVDYQKSSAKLKKLNTYLIKLQGKLQNCRKEHSFFEDNHVCPTCTQELSHDFRQEKLTEGKVKLDEMTVGEDELVNAIKEEEIRFEKFTELSTEVNNLNTTVNQSNYQVMTIRKQIDSI